MLADLPPTAHMARPCKHECYWRRERAKLPASTRASIRRVIACESGGNYKINTGNGYYGAGQWSISTGRVAGFRYGRADLASPAEQDVRMVRFVKRYGIGHWPVCGRYW